MTKAEKIIGSLVLILGLAALFFWKDIRSITSGETQLFSEQSTVGKKKEKKKEKVKEGKNPSATASDPAIKIIEKWDLPSELKEISGITYIGYDQFACVQDELGKIFVFNTKSRKVEKEIGFAGAGDYEGIALVNSTIYVLRADGKLFEVQHYNEPEPTIIEHSTHLTEKQNVEGLSYDKRNNRLLLAIKGKEPQSNDYKGIYAFDLTTKKSATTAVYRIDLNHSLFKGTKGKNKIQPSDLEVHPATGDVYVIDGPGPGLLVMDSEGNKKNLYRLSSSDFSQPEGITFNDAGELFISNEGTSGDGNILKVEIVEEESN
jgi:uncharacterized protein YjiK